MPLISFTQAFLVMTVRACRRNLRTESSLSCHTSKARSSPSTCSFRSMLLSCGGEEAGSLPWMRCGQRTGLGLPHTPCSPPPSPPGCLMPTDLHHVPEHIAKCVSV